MHLESYSYMIFVFTSLRLSISTFLYTKRHSEFMNVHFFNIDLGISQTSWVYKLLKVMGNFDVDLSHTVKKLLHLKALRFLLARFTPKGLRLKEPSVTWTRYFVCEYKRVQDSHFHLLCNVGGRPDASLRGREMKQVESVRGYIDRMGVKSATVGYNNV